MTRMKRIRGGEEGMTTRSAIEDDDDRKGKRGKSSPSVAAAGAEGGGGTTSTKTFVHPLAIASARLRARGIDELSKAINLGGLVIGGEYFGLSNVVVVDKLAPGGEGRSGGGGGSKVKLDGSSSSSENGGGGGGKEKGGEIRGDHGGGPDLDAAASSSTNVYPSNSIPSSSSSSSSSIAAAETMTMTTDETAAMDQRHRSAYVLRRRKSQYDGASRALSRHARRLSLSIAATRVLDARLRELRGRWKLAVPEHGTRASAGPVRPEEAVAVDMEVYRGHGGGGGGGAPLGRIARRIPRFATLELDDEHDISEEVRLLRMKIKNVINGLKRANDDADDDIMEVDGNNLEEKTRVEFPLSSFVRGPCKTKVEPFAVNDPTIGKIDPDFDPNKVPLLTLVFEIEKPSTGFVERATLSSSFLSLSKNDKESSLGRDDPGGGGRHLNPDERVIEALQHSLFCASFFESIRTEIIPIASAHSNLDTAKSSSQQRQKLITWLSSEMEESFLPPPSVMAGGGTSRSNDAQMLCVIHCHEGELKVQLNDEYSLTVKLIEAGVSNHVDAAVTAKDWDNNGGTGTGMSGSLSPIQLKTLCRALLLHSQLLYHDYCMNIPRGSSFHSAVKVEEKPLLGFARAMNETKPPSPHILQSCVGLGCKFIIEKKVQAMLKVCYCTFSRPPAARCVLYD
ncbi:hypothetical protein ACHAXA_008088 [Cyclostephanos tholiformis]|uniref:Mediator of RNA polymerase II transcription subunit 17 n=1 Tax=Cyclostephanos tholiformis TaxID=382380 RepID=A0ABD3RVP5_9STRA